MSGRQTKRAQLICKYMVNANGHGGYAYCYPEMVRHKNQFFALAALLLLSILVGCQPVRKGSAADVYSTQPDSDVPMIVFSSKEHDFGKVAAGKKSTYSFGFSNAGGKDLEIKKIRTSCGCTTTTARNTTIKPGQASEIEVTYKAGYSGKAKKRIMVYTNDPQNPEIELWISAEITDSAKSTNTASNSKSSSQPESPPKKDDMPKTLKSFLRNLNKATY